MKVKVDTTTEFPLDVVCTLMFTSKDMEEYEALDKKQKEEKERHIIRAPLEERANDEV